jgi:hypothetical protein
MKRIVRVLTTKRQSASPRLAKINGNPTKRIVRILTTESAAGSDLTYEKELLKSIKNSHFYKTNHPGKGNNGGLGGLMEDLISTQITTFLAYMPILKVRGATEESNVAVGQSDCHVPTQSGLARTKRGSVGFVEFLESVGFVGIATPQQVGGRITLLVVVARLTESAEAISVGSWDCHASLAMTMGECPQ